MITYHKGNLLKDDAGALVNTVNTVGVMGKGIALAFRNNYPHNYQVYRDACRNKKLDIGQLLIVEERHLFNGTKVIINFPTKKHWKNPSEYDFITAGLEALHNYLSARKVKSLAMPALGCGNGGLEWERVKDMIEKTLGHFELDIRVYEPG